MATRPISRARRLNSANGIWAYGQRETDCLSRPAGRIAISCRLGRPRPASAAPEAVRTALRSTRPSPGRRSAAVVSQLVPVHLPHGVVTGSPPERPVGGGRGLGGGGGA